MPSMRPIPEIHPSVLSFEWPLRLLIMSGVLTLLALLFILAIARRSWIFLILFLLLATAFGFYLLTFWSLGRT